MYQLSMDHYRDFFLDGSHSHYQPPHRKKKNPKKGNGKANFCYLKEKCVYISHKQKQKVIYFKKNKLYKIQFRIFSPMLVENIE